MIQVQSLENKGLKKIIFKIPSESYSKTQDLETILHKLYYRENEIFKKIVIAIRINDNTQSMMLASELLKIRILKRNLCLGLELLYRFNSKHSI